MSIEPIVTKIRIPPQPVDFLHRERLTDFLHENIDRKLLVITAPAGYGKTALLIDFAHETDLPVCWYTLDERDDDPVVFLEHLIGSLAQRFPTFGDETRRLLEGRPSLTGGAVEVIGTLVNEIVAKISEWFVLVLDDFHHIADAGHVNEILETLIAYQPEHLHLIVASRAVPHRLSLGALAARGEAVGMEQKDLRFTPEEVHALFGRNRYVNLTSREAEDLAKMAEGWITAILLARHSNWQGTLEIWARARRSGIPLYDYLAGEVLDRQAPALRAFLLASSTLEEMTPELCADVLGLEDVARHFREVERRNLFASRVSETEDRLRYHALFRDFLQTRLRDQSTATFYDLHRKVAAWFEENSSGEAAARHYLVCDMPEEAARAIDQVAQALLRAGHLETLCNWAGRLPLEIVRTMPGLLTHVAEAAYGLGDLKQASVWLELAKTTCRENNDTAHLASVLSSQALILCVQGRYVESAEVAKDVLSLLPADSTVNEDALVEAHRVLGACLTKQGHFEEAEGHFQTALAHGQTLANKHRLVLIQQGLSLCLLNQGRLEEATEIDRATVEMCRQLGSPAYLAEALNNLAYGLYALGDYGEALDALQEALEGARRIGHRRVEAYVLLSLGEIVLELGDPAAATEMIEQGLGVAGEVGQAHLLPVGKAALALAQLYDGDGPSALVSAHAAIDLARPGARSQLGSIRATLGLAEIATGEIEEGVRSLETACDELADVGVENELARAKLFLAYSLYQAGQDQRAMVQLSEALDVYLREPSGQRLLVDSQYVRPMLEAASAAGIAGSRLVEVLEEATSFDRQAAQALRAWRARSTPTPTTLRAYGFGPGHVERDGQPIPLSQSGAATVPILFFFYFLSHPPQTKERVAADIWPDLSSAHVTGTFHTTKTRMQHALGVKPIVFEDGLYRVDTDVETWHDVWEFERLLHSARRASDGAAIRYLRKAVDLYAGDFLEGCYADWCIQRREALRQRYLEAVGRLTGALLDRRRADDAIPLLRSGLETDNLREDFHRQLMRAYAIDGRPEVATAHYHRCARILQEELGVAPDAETQALHDAIRAGRILP